MAHQLKAYLLVIGLCLGAWSPKAAAVGAQPQVAAEERFQDLFVTSGYCTAFGAALGTAFLAFTANPTENLRFVAVGASLGFIGGSALGSYIIFSPLMSAEGPNRYQGSLASEAPLPAQGLVLRPMIDRASHKLTTIEGGMTLARF